MSRQQERGDLPPEMRMRMLEEDMDRSDEHVKHVRGNIEVQIQAVDKKLHLYTDKLETRLEKVQKETDAEMDALRKETSEEIAGNRKVMVGVLISTLSVAIAIVAQVLVMRGGS